MAPHRILGVRHWEVVRIEYLSVGVVCPIWSVCLSHLTSVGAVNILRTLYINNYKMSKTHFLYSWIEQSASYWFKSACLSECLSANFWCIQGTLFIFGMHIPWLKQFQMTFQWWQLCDLGMDIVLHKHILLVFKFQIPCINKKISSMLHHATLGESYIWHYCYTWIFFKFFPLVLFVCFI